MTSRVLRQVEPSELQHAAFTHHVDIEIDTVTQRGYVRIGPVTLFAELVAEHDLTTVVRESLQEFADPKPPRLDEPIGRYAVVEDVAAVEWVRADVAGHYTWQSIEGAKSRWANFADIAVVRVLSEGVSQ